MTGSPWCERPLRPAYHALERVSVPGDWFAAFRVAPELRDRLVLAVDEACTNVIRHAYGGECTRRIALHVARERDMLAFELRDQAPAVDPACLKPRDLSECRPGGLGLPFIDATMDDWTLEPAAEGQGNILRMHKRLIGDDQ